MGLLINHYIKGHTNYKENLRILDYLITHGGREMVSPEVRDFKGNPQMYYGVDSNRNIVIVDTLPENGVEHILKPINYGTNSN